VNIAAAVLSDSMHQAHHGFHFPGWQPALGIDRQIIFRCPVIFNMLHLRFLLGVFAFE
jgi:hypothetical protein